MIISGVDEGLELQGEGDAAARLFFLLHTMDAMQTRGDLSVPEVLPHLPSVKDLVKEAIVGRKRVEPWKSQAWLANGLSRCEAKLEEAAWKV